MTPQRQTATAKLLLAKVMGIDEAPSRVVEACAEEMAGIIGFRGALTKGTFTAC